MARNFIPEGEDNSTSVRPFGQRSRNFVPEDGAPEAVKGLGADGQFEQALAEVAMRAETSKQRQWDEATATMLRFSQLGDAVGVLQSMAPANRELHLLAEEMTSHRSAVLSRFPAAGPTARETWKDYASPAQAAVPARKGK